MCRPSIFSLECGSVYIRSKSRFLVLMTVLAIAMLVNACGAKPTTDEIVESESDNDVYIIEGFEIGFDNLGLPAEWANWYRLKIRKSDFALIESTKLDFPTLILDENGKVTQRMPEEGTDMSTFPMGHMRATLSISLPLSTEITG